MHAITALETFTRLIAALVSAVVVAGALAGCDEPAAPEVPVRPVISMVVGGVERLRADTYPGRAKATQEVDIAFEVPGQLVERPVDVGDEVKAGDVLAKLNPGDFENALAAAVAERNRAKANFDRVAQAAKSGAVSKQDLSNARAVFQADDARVGIAEKALNDTLIVAPFDGTVAATYVENFQNVLAKQPVLRLLDTSQIEMEVSVPESLIGLAPYVTEIRVTFKALPGVEIPATIKEVGNEASLTTRTYPVTIIMEQPPGGEIRPGMAGEAAALIQLPDDWIKQGVAVPASAVFSPDDASKDEVFVWIVDESSETVKRRRVEIVATEARGIRIRGVKAGERIVTAGVSYLDDGQQVRLRAN